MALYTGSNSIDSYRTAWPDNLAETVNCLLMQGVTYILTWQPNPSCKTKQKMPW